MQTPCLLSSERTITSPKPPFIPLGRPNAYPRLDSSIKSQALFEQLFAKDLVCRIVDEPTNWNYLRMSKLTLQVAHDHSRTYIFVAQYCHSQAHAPLYLHRLPRSQPTDIMHAVMGVSGAV